MNTLIVAILGIAGLWNTSMALVMKTQNMRSSLYFKVIPFFIGTACIFACGKLAGLF